jgi:putative membrane protein
MKNVISFLSASMIAVACSLTIQSCEDKKAESHDSAEVAEKENDRKFETSESEKNADLVAKSVEYNYAVIALAELAETRAVRKDVKEVAKEIKKGHEESLAELKVIAEKEGISVATGPSDKAEEKIEDLSEKDADKFDKKWVNKLIEKHKKSIDELEDALNNDKIHGIEKEWANKSLPALKAHLEKLKAIDEAIKS